MKKEIILFLSLILFSVPAFTMAVSDDDSPVTGFLDITVESNVNKVLFSYPISSSNLTAADRRTTNIIVPVKDFVCNNKIAFKDFLTLLKAESYPDLTIELPAIALQQLHSETPVTLRNVTINIAGVSREYDITCVPENLPDGERVLAGTILVDLNDLNITPPVKYFGMVKIKDEVIVKFGLGIKNQDFARK